MTPTLSAALVTAGSLAYLALLGYGPALMLLPVRLRPWFWLVTPLVGLVAAALTLGWLTLWLPGGTAGWVGLAAMLAFAAWRMVRGDRPPEGQRGLEQAVCLAFCALAAGLALAPLVGRPDLISIGRNWDVEIYLPMAAYLEHSPLGFGLTAPAGFPFPGLPNPLLWRANFFDPRWSGLTFQEVHAAIDALAGLQPHQSFTGIMAAFFGLTPAAVFLLVRAGLGAGRIAGLVAGLLTALGAPGLWVVFWSFGQQVSALALTPLALVAFCSAVRGPDLRSRAFAGATAAALLATYVPAVPVYLAGAACILLAEALPARHWRSALTGTLVCAGIAVALAPWALLRCAERAWHFLDDRGVSGLTVGPDVHDFPPLGWGFGLYAGPDQGFAGLLPPDGSFEGLRVVLLVVVAVGAVACWRRGEYAAAALSLAPALVLLPLRYLAPYPYGYLKTMAFATPLLLGLLVVGTEALWARRGRSGALLKVGVTLAAVLMVAVNASSAIHLVLQARDESPMAYRTVEQITQAIPSGARVFVSGHRDMWGPKGGALAYALRRTDLYGYMATGFSSFYRERDDGTYDYALFSENEPAWREVLGTATPVWSALGLNLYKMPAGLLAYVSQGDGAPPVIERTGGQGGTAGLRITEWTDDGNPDFSGWSPPLMGTLAEITPPQVRYPMVTRGVNYETTVPATAVAQGQASVQVSIASLQAQTVTVKLGEQNVVLDVPAGLSSHNLGRTGAPDHVVVLDNANQAPLWIRSLSVWSSVPAIEANPQDAVLVSHAARLAEGSVMFDASYIGPGLQPVIDVYSVDGTVHYGYWVLGSNRAGLRAFHLRLDPQHYQLLPQRREGAAPFASMRGESPDGDYRMYLFLWKDGKVVQQVPLCTFTLRAKRAVSVTPEFGDLFIG